MSKVVSYLRCLILNHILNLLHHKLANGTLRRITHTPHILSTQTGKTTYFKKMYVHIPSPFRFV